MSKLAFDGFICLFCNKGIKLDDGMARFDCPNCKGHFSWKRATNYSLVLCDSWGDLYTSVEEYISRFKTAGVPELSEKDLRDDQEDYYQLVPKKNGNVTMLFTQHLTCNYQVDFKRILSFDYMDEYIKKHIG